MKRINWGSGPTFCAIVATVGAVASAFSFFTFKQYAPPEILACVNLISAVVIGFAVAALIYLLAFPVYPKTRAILIRRRVAAVALSIVLVMLGNQFFSHSGILDNL